jgi:hypothetical protein
MPIYSQQVLLAAAAAAAAAAAVAQALKVCKELLLYLVTAHIN